MPILSLMCQYCQHILLQINAKYNKYNPIFSIFGANIGDLSKNEQCTSWMVHLKLLVNRSPQLLEQGQRNINQNEL